MEGWIKIYRKISDNPLWTCEPFTRGQAWVDLILLASFNDTFFYVRGIKIEQKRGQVCWSEPKLADRWKWSRTKLRKFLNDLEKEQQIMQQKNNVTQVITIINYDEYQEKEQQTGQQKDSRKTAKRQQKDVIEECKEIQECKEEYKGNKLPIGEGNPHTEKIDFDKLIIFFNSQTNEIFGKVQMPISDKRRKMISARIKEHGKNTFSEVVKKAAASDFLRGQNQRGFTATFDWIIKPTNFEKILSGNYDNRSNQSRGSGKTTDEQLIEAVGQGLSRAACQE